VPPPSASVTTWERSGDGSGTPTPELARPVSVTAAAPVPVPNIMVGADGTASVNVRPVVAMPSNAPAAAAR